MCDGKASRRFVEEFFKVQVETTENTEKNQSNIVENNENPEEIKLSLVQTILKMIKKVIMRIKKGIIRFNFKLLNRILITFCKLDDKKVLFVSDARDHLGGNLEYMYNYIPKDKYNIILNLKPDRRVKRSIKQRLNLVYEISTAKYILLDDFCTNISLMKVRKNQEVCQLWHGPGAFKKFGYSRYDKQNIKINKANSHRNYTKVPVTSEDIRWCYAEGFGTNINNVKATGFARTDMLFNKEEIEQKKKNLYEDYPYLQGKKVVLFAPTYRGTSLKNSYYDFEKLDIDKLYKKLKDEYVFIFKWHPGLYFNMKKNELNPYDFEKYPNFFYDFSEERDINDLLLITDVLVTDYSSVIFDYAFLNKPIVYFTYDLEEYEEGRGLYFPFEDYIYGKVAKTDDELIDAIKAGDLEEEKRKKFMDKFLSACDGNSTKKTYEWIFENKE